MPQTNSLSSTAISLSGIHLYLYLVLTAGAATQEIKILERLPHMMDSHPLAATLNPTMAAMMVCVVDTGKPYAVARINQNDAFTRATSIPKANTSC